MFSKIGTANEYARRPLHTARWLQPLQAVLLTAALAIGGAQAQSSGLAGYWRGSGYIIPPEGRREKVRCRVWIDRISARSFGVRALCASQAANIEQSGRVVQTGRNRYSGEFYNSEYNVRGRIFISLRGNRQSVTMRSDAASGRLTLFRR